MDRSEYTASRVIFQVKTQLHWVPSVHRILIHALIAKSSTASRSLSQFAYESKLDGRNARRTMQDREGYGGKDRKS